VLGISKIHDRASPMPLCHFVSRYLGDQYPDLCGKPEVIDAVELELAGFLAYPAFIAIARDSTTE
jgi:hypothetical protein